MKQFIIVFFLMSLWFICSSMKYMESENGDPVIEITRNDTFGIFGPGCVYEVLGNKLYSSRTIIMKDSLYGYSGILVDITGFYNCIDKKYPDPIYIKILVFDSDGESDSIYNGDVNKIEIFSEDTVSHKNNKIVERELGYIRKLLDYDVKNCGISKYLEYVNNYFKNMQRARLHIFYFIDPHNINIDSAQSGIYSLPVVTNYGTVDAVDDKLHGGKEFSEFSGMYYYDNEARQYDPVTMRFYLDYNKK